MQIAMSWGQVWMRDSWRRFYNWYEQTKHNKLACINNIYCFKEWGEKSWLKYHIAYCIDQNKYFVYPYSSYSTNCADKGTHVTTNLFVFQSPLNGVSKKIHIVSLLSLTGLTTIHIMKTDAYMKLFKYQKPILY